MLSERKPNQDAVPVRVDCQCDRPVVTGLPGVFQSEQSVEVDFVPDRLLLLHLGKNPEPIRFTPPLQWRW